MEDLAPSVLGREEEVCSLSWQRSISYSRNSLALGLSNALRTQGSCSEQSSERAAAPPGTAGTCLLPSRAEAPRSAWLSWGLRGEKERLQFCAGTGAF